MKNPDEKSITMAEARFNAARANSLSLSKFIELIEKSEYTPALTLYYRDGEEYGISRVHAARNDCDLSDELLFFSFEPTQSEEEKNNEAITTIRQTLFLKETYQNRWFVSDPALDGI